MELTCKEVFNVEMKDFSQCDEMQSFVHRLNSSDVSNDSIDVCGDNGVDRNMEILDLLMAINNDISTDAISTDTIKLRNMGWTSLVGEDKKKRVYVHSSGCVTTSIKACFASGLGNTLVIHQKFLMACNDV